MTETAGIAGDYKLERRIGLVLFSGIFLFYFLLAPAFSVPGRWAGIAAVFSGLDPFRPLIRPVWSGLTALLAALPIGNIGYAYNILTSFSGAAVCWLLFEIIRRIPFERTFRRVTDAQEERVSRLMAGVAAALFAAASSPMIVFSTRGDYAVFDAFILLLALYPLMRYVEQPSSRWLFASCFLMGLAVVEYPTAAMALPVYLFGWVYVLWRKSPSHRVGRYIAAGALLFSGLVGLILYAMIYAGTASASFRELSSPFEVIASFSRLYALELTRSVPKVGWLLVIGTTVVPFFVVLFRQLDEPDDRFSALGVNAFRFVLFVVALLILFELPGSPAYVIGQQNVLLAPALMTAAWSGFLVAYYVRLLSLRLPGLTGARAVAFIWLLILVAAGTRHAIFAGINHVKSVVAFAEETIAHLKGRDLIVTDGSLDAALRLAARQAGLKVHVIDMNADASIENGRWLASIFDDPYQKSMAMLGPKVLLSDWLAGDTTASTRVAFLASPEHVRNSKTSLFPDAYFYEVKSADDASDAVVRFDDAAARWQKFIASSSDEHQANGAGTYHLTFVRQWLSRLANDMGYALEESGEGAQAVRAYERSLDLWPENPSAILNLMEHPIQAENSDGRDELKKKYDALVSENPLLQNAVYLNARAGRLRNPHAMLAYLAGQNAPGDRALGDVALRLPADDQTSRFNLARLYLREQNLDESESIYRALIAENPGHVDAHYGLLRVAMARGDAAKAREWIEAMKGLGVDQQILRQEEAAIGLLEGNVEKARSDYLSIVKENDRNTGAWLALAQIARQTQDLDLMQSAFAVLERERSFAPGMLMLGDQALTDGRAEDARDYYARALELEPQNQNTLIRLMLLAHRLSDFDSLRMYSGRLLSINPDHTIGNMMAGYVYMDAEEFDLAEASFRRSLSAGENTDLLHDLSRALFAQGKVADARTFARKSVTLEPQHANAWGTLARIEWSMGLADDATKSLQQAMSLDLTRAPGVYLIAAERSIAQDNPAMADEMLEKAGLYYDRLSKSQKKQWSDLMVARGKTPQPPLVSAPGNSLDVSADSATLSEAKVAYEKAVAALADKNLNEARAELIRARELQPDHPMVLGLSGRVELQAGDFNQAAVYWRQLLEQYPENASVEAGLAALDLYRGDDAAAAARIEKARRLNRADPLTVLYAAVLTLRENRDPDWAARIGEPGTRALAVIADSMVSEKTHLFNVISAAQYDELCRVFFRIAPDKNPAGVLSGSLPEFNRAVAALENQNWTEVANVLTTIHDGGVSALSILYDLALALYKLDPGPDTLSKLADILRLPGGNRFAGVFVLVCLQDGREAEAEQLAGEWIDQMPQVDATLIRAALRRSQDDTDGAWNLLERIPFEQRTALIPWFDQDLKVAEKLKKDQQFVDWLFKSESN